jgi:DNA-directed RNA polymerase I subunit RPA1
LYAAKLKLIHAGMLVEASSLDMILSFKQMKDDENESEQKPVEGTAAIIDKIDDFVKESFKNKTIKMFTKTTLIIDALRKLEKEFLAAIPPHTCQNCGGASPKYRKEGLTKIFEKPLPASTRNTMLAKGLSRAKLFADAPNIEDFDQDIYVSPITIKTHFKLLWEKESVILDLMYGNVRNNHRISSPEMFFLDMVAVTPSKFRPVSKLGIYLL